MKSTNAYPTHTGKVRFGRTVNVYFPAAPPSKIRDALKEAGFRFFGHWTYDSSDVEDAVRATKTALNLGCQLDLVGKLLSGFGYFEKAQALVGDAPVIVDTPQFLRAKHKSYLTFDSISELIDWMKQF